MIRLLPILCLMWMVRIWHGAYGWWWYIKISEPVVVFDEYGHGKHILPPLSCDKPHRDKISALRCVIKTIGKEGKDWKEAK